MDDREFEVIVIGTGVTGQTAAEELGEAGKHVGVVERREVGGTCSLRGCEPKKVLVSAAEVVERAAAQQGAGPVGSMRLHWPEAIAFKRTFTDPAPARIESAITGTGAHVIRGSARFVDDRTLIVGDDRYRASDVIIATGARPVTLGVPGEDLVTTSEGFMAAENLGDRVVFIGGGYISFEFAHIAAATGARVTIVHRHARVLPGFDADLSAQLVTGYRMAGIDVRLDTRVLAVERENDALAVVLGDGSRLECDRVVHGAGRVPDLDDLDLPAGGIAFGRHGIDVDSSMRSVSRSGIWAAGDAAALSPPLTPVGIAQARVIVRNLTGRGPATFEPAAIPSVVFSDPPLASVGLRADDVDTDEPDDVDIRSIDTSSWVSSQRVGTRVSGAKVLTERSTGRILGAHLLGHNAEEVINVFTAAIVGGLTADQIRAIPWAYPTASSEIVYLP
jgi:glutathione reductase (NADPH)